MEEKTSKLIFNCGVARKLLKMGCTIIDIKPDHENKDRTVFVFLKDKKFDTSMEEITNSINEKRGA